MLTIQSIVSLCCQQTNSICLFIILVGFYNDAVTEYKEALQVAEAREDKIGSAVAHRMVGECLCALGKYKDALFHQNLHLQVRYHHPM